MKKILISSFDMEIGGVERSLINMLENFNYKDYQVDLMLYRHQGEFMKLLPSNNKLLEEMEEYSTFRQSITEIFRRKRIALGLVRIFAKYIAKFAGVLWGTVETGYYQMQLMWKHSLPFLPRLGGQYDVAISYLWPHYFVAEKVNAALKIAWIHTDYSTITTDVKMDEKMWDKFDYIIAVSEHCRETFLIKYPRLENKTIVIENITSPQFIKMMAKEDIGDMKRECGSFNILTVSRLSYAKGIDNAVRAMKLLYEKGMNNIKWYVIGYGSDEQYIRGLIAQYSLFDRFVLLGKKTNPYPYMRMCDLYVQPSRYEGKAVTVTEAQILGKPVLITNYATAKSQVRDGVDGIITELSVEGIANGIERLYKNYKLRQRIANTCIRTDYSNNNELDKLYNLINGY